MTTRLGLSGGPAIEYGDFSGKSSAAVTKSAVTRLGLYGGPSQLYSDFAPKTGGTPPSSEDQVTRLGLYGGPRQLYGEFDPKTGGGVDPVLKDQITRLGLYGGPRFLYGDFTEKTPADVTDGPDTGGGSKSYRRYRPGISSNWTLAMQEDEELLSILQGLFNKH